jgi:hypothetical protein
MSADIISMDKLRALQAPKPEAPEPDPVQAKLEVLIYGDHEAEERARDRHKRWDYQRQLADAGDTAALEQIATYALERYEEAKEAVNSVARCRQRTSGHGREKYTLPNLERSWDVVGLSGQSVAEEIEQHLEEVWLMLVANRADEALRAINGTHHCLKYALNRRDEAKRRAQRQVKQDKRATRDRAELERQRQRIEQQLAAFGPAD